MRRVRVDRTVTAGARLAHEVVGPGGEIIARAGYPLTWRAADALATRGVSWCYVDDAVSAGVALKSLDGGAGAVRAVFRAVWSRVAEAAAPYASMNTAKAIAAIRRAQPTAAVRLSAPFIVLPEAVSDLVSLARLADAQSGYVTARQSADDEEGHAVGVAVLSGWIATLLALPSHEVFEVVTAALLHDIGLVCVPAAVRHARPALWTEPERRRYQDHAAFGAALLEPLAEPSLHLAAVAGEHHEAQDGSGYPAGKTGGNRVLRTAEERRDRERISLYAEIVAVADYYERLLSPSPGYVGRSPPAARPLLAEAAGTTLNREIVTRFLASFPALPLGSEVRLAGGELPGALAIVYAVAEGAEAPPRVRLIADAEGHPVEPVVVDLASAPQTGWVPVDDVVDAAIAAARPRRVLPIRR